MSLPVKLIAVDLDGTLLDGQKQVCEAGAMALKRAEAAGIHIVVATARTIESTGRVVGGQGFQGPVIANTGAMVYDRLGGEVWASHLMPRKTAHEIAAFADARQWGLSILIEGVSHYSWDRATENDFMGAERNTRVNVASSVAAVTGDVTQMLVRDVSAIQEMQDFCESQHGQHIRCQPFYLADGSIEAIAILPRLATKGDALATAAKRLGVGLEHVLALGDNDSDIPMFERAGIAVCMENGTERAKAAADHVGPHHEEQGVAWAVKEFALKGVMRGKPPTVTPDLIRGLT